MAAANLTLLNSIAEAVGAEGGHRYNLDALNAISQQLTGIAGHTRNLSALNAIAGHYIGATQSFTLNIDAMNAIAGKLGGASNSALTVSALAAWMGNTGQGASLAIEWTDNSGQEAGQRIEKRIAGETEWATALTVAANVESATITGLPFNTEMEIRVIPFNGAGDLPVTETLQVYTAPPLAPTGFALTATGAGTATASWTRPAIEPVTGYKLRYRIVGAPSWTVQVVAAGATLMNVTGLTASESYEGYLTAYNANVGQLDSETAASATIAITTFAALESAAINTNGNTLTLRFSGPVTVGAGGSGGFTLTPSGAAATLTYVSGSGTNTLAYTISRTVFSTETATLALVQPGNGIEDGFGNDVASFAGVNVTNGSTQLSYLLALDFEEAGVPTGFVSDNPGSSGINWDATDWPGGVPQGMQSAKITANNQLCHFDLLTPASEVWAYAIVHIAAGTAVSVVPFRIRDSLNANLAFMEFRSDTSLRAYSGSASTSTATGQHVFGTTYHVWVRYVKGSGANAISEIYLSTDGIRPATPKTSRIGTVTTDAARLSIDPSSTANLWLDKVRVSATEIGSNPA